MFEWLIESGLALWAWFPGWSQVGLINLGLIVVIVVPLLLCVAYLTFAERKLIGYMQVRVGPNRVGPRGWLQPIADALKLLLKEIIIPTNANKFLFRHCAGIGDRTRPRRLGSDPIYRYPGVGQYRCQPAVHLGGYVDGCVRCYRRRLGVKF